MDMRFGYSLGLLALSMAFIASPVHAKIRPQAPHGQGQVNQGYQKQGKQVQGPKTQGPIRQGMSTHGGASVSSPTISFSAKGVRVLGGQLVMSE